MTRAWRGIIVSRFIGLVQSNKDHSGCHSFNGRWGEEGERDEKRPLGGLLGAYAHPPFRKNTFFCGLL